MAIYVFFSPVWFAHSKNTCMCVCLCLDSASYEPEIEWQLFSHTDCLWFLKHHYCLHELCVTAGVVSHSQTYLLSSVSVQENRPAAPIIIHNAVVCLYFIRLITIISGGAEPGMQWWCKISVGEGGNGVRAESSKAVVAVSCSEEDFENSRWNRGEESARILTAYIRWLILLQLLPLLMSMKNQWARLQWLTSCCFQDIVAYTSFFSHSALKAYRERKQNIYVNWNSGLCLIPSCMTIQLHQALKPVPISPATPPSLSHQASDIWTDWGAHESPLIFRPRTLRAVGDVAWQWFVTIHGSRAMAIWPDGQSQCQAQEQHFTLDRPSSI